MRDPKNKQLKQQIQTALTPQQKKQIKEFDIFSLQQVKNPVLGNDFGIYDVNSLRDHVKFPFQFNSARGKVRKTLPLKQAVKLYRSQIDKRKKGLKLKDIAKYVALLEKFKKE